MKTFESNRTIKYILGVIFKDIEGIRFVHERTHIQGELILNYEVLSNNPQQKWELILSKINEAYKEYSEGHIVMIGNKLKINLILK